MPCTPTLWPSNLLPLRQTLPAPRLRVMVSSRQFAVPPSRITKYPQPSNKLLPWVAPTVLRLELVVLMARQVQLPMLPALLENYRAVYLWFWLHLYLSSPSSPCRRLCVPALFPYHIVLMMVGLVIWWRRHVTSRSSCSVHLQSRGQVSIHKAGLRVCDSRRAVRRFWLRCLFSTERIMFCFFNFF